MDGPVGSVARQERDALIERYQSYVEVVTHKLIRHLGLPYDRRDDLVSAGMIGLVEAASRYHPESNDAFEKYAYLRIRGAVIDAIRRESELKPHGYRRAMALQAANDLRLEEFHRSSVGARQRSPGAQPTEELDALFDYASKAILVHRLSVEDAEIELTEKLAPEPTPEDRLNARQQQKKLHEIIATLPERERLVIEQLYFKDVSLSDIASNHGGISKSWISRLHDKALCELRSKLIGARYDRDSQEADTLLKAGAPARRSPGRPRKHERRLSGVNSNKPIRKRGKSSPRPSGERRI